jgi:hypothetical protein
MPCHQPLCQAGGGAGGARTVWAYRLTRQPHPAYPSGRSFQLLDLSKVVLGGETAVEGHLPRDASVDLLLTLDHAHGECRVRRIAVLQPLQAATLRDEAERSDQVRIKPDLDGHGYPGCA